jgi:predicted nucleic acid-binding protein
MKYVLDSSVAVKWVLSEPESDKALKVRDDFNNRIHELLAPDVFPVEVAHALARAERRGVIQPPEGTLKLVDILNNLPDLHSYLPLLPRAFAIASQFRIGVYDCLYVSLAEREGGELLTADDRLIRTLQPTFSFIISLASLP